MNAVALRTGESLLHLGPPCVVGHGCIVGMRFGENGAVRPNDGDALTQYGGVAMSVITQHGP